MSINRSIIHCSLAGLTCTVLATGVHADPPVLEPVIVQTNDSAPPGFPGLFWNLSGGFTNPVIDDAGKIAFSGRIFGDGVTAANNRVLWHGETGNWTILARNADAAPSLPGLTLLGISTNAPLITPNGQVSISSTLAGPGVTANVNDSAAWMGLPGNATLAIRRGDAAPSTAGATLNTSMILGQTRANNAGQIMIVSPLAGGDTVTANNAGVYLASPTGVTKAWRKGDPAPGAPALPDASGPFISHSTFGLHLNGSGSVLMTGTLVAGTAGGVTTSDDSIVFVATNGTPRIVARENDLVPNITDTKYKVAAGFNLAARALNNGGKSLFNATLDNANGGTSVTLANDSVWLVEDNGVVTTAVREGDAIPGAAGGTFSLANFTNIMLNNNDRLAFAGVAATGTANLNCLWEGPIGGPYTPIMVQGDPVPGLTDVVNAFNISSANIAYNNANQVVFNSTLGGPAVTVGVNDRAIFAWDATNGLQMIARTGVTTIPDMLDLALLSLGGSTAVNGECGSTMLTDNGWLTFIVQDLKGYQAIVRTDLSAAPLCVADIDGSGAVDINDLLEVINNWGACANPKDCPADVDGDDQIDINDLLEVINTWGDCP